MRILVLGLTGYLGGHAAEQLRALPGARLLGGGRAPAAGLAVDLATIGSRQLADKIASFEPDAVVNCAGAVGGDAVTLAEVNARGPAVLCAALREAAPRARLVHLGSAAEYGPTAHGERVTEEAATRPAGPYGATKLAGTVAVTASGLDSVVLRVGNPVGPGAPAAGLPGRLVRQLRQAGRADGDPDAVVRLGDLSAYRDFVDVRDIARAVVLATTAPGPLPPVLNIGGGRALPVRDLVHGLARAADFQGRIEESRDGSPRSSDVSWQCSDITAAANALGWVPRYGLAESLADLWASARTGPEPERAQTQAPPLAPAPESAGDRGR
ncbi:NAD-dependent epimerase/dehydratase family protein [Streptomyces sp. NPDC059479]|uniref:NAD-dependent epimerase/dehydratase family protein n=1 Tax=Streptomyces sp. NPDC059479 TaxID=3346848 RepID=UPI0036BE514B